MLIKPNATHLRVEVLTSRPSDDGVGTELEVRVLENHSLDENDFLKPPVNHHLVLYSRTRIPSLDTGAIVDIQAELKAGPFGQKIVCRDVKPVADR